MRAALLLSLLLTLFCGRAEADGAAYRARFEKANRQFLVGRYREALTDFEQLFVDSANPVLLFNIGQCRRLLGEPDEAIRAYRNYLQQVPNAENRAEVERIIAELTRPAAPAAAPSTYVFPGANPADSMRLERLRQARKARNKGLHEIVWGSIFGAAATTLTAIAIWQLSERGDKELGGHVLGPLIPGLVLGAATFPLLILGPPQYVKGRQAMREAEAP